MMRFQILLAAGALSLMLGGCGGGVKDKAELDKIDAKLGGKAGADPALSAALEDQIMVDPNLASQANEDSIRPTNEPFQAPVPVDLDAALAPPGQTLGSLAEQQMRLSKDKFNGCSLDVKYSMDFVNRLPADLPLYPKARVAEAAGSDSPTCRLRAVTYSSNEAPQALASFYLALAKNAGFAAKQTKESGRSEERRVGKEC